MSTNNEQSKNEQPKIIKDMSGYIAKNTRRTKDTQPHFRGKIRISGKEYLLSIWEKDGEIMSVSVTDPAELDARKQNPTSPNPAPTQPKQGGQDGVFDDIFQF